MRRAMRVVADALITRYIPYFNGTDMYITMSGANVLAASDTFTVSFATLSTGSLSTILKGAVDFDAGDLIQLTTCTATIDGDSVADGADISSYLDGGVHELIITATGALTIDEVYWNGTSQYFPAHLLSVASNISSTVVEWVFDTVETTTVNDTAGGNPITLTNFAASDYEKYSFADDLWNWLGSLIGGSVLFEFTGTASTPTTGGIAVTGSAFKMNWIGLYVDANSTHTYTAAPDGENIRLDIADPASVTNLNISLRRWAGSIPDLSSLTSLSSFSGFNNSFTGSIPSLVANAALSIFNCYANSLSGSIPSLTVNTALTTFSCHSNSLTGSIPNLTANTALTNFLCYNNSLSGVIPSLSANVALINFWAFGNSFTGYTASTLASTLDDFRLQDCAVSDPDDIDQILADLDTAGGSNGDVTLQGGTNAIPSAAGLTSKSNLEGKGWTVTVNS